MEFIKVKKDKIDVTEIIETDSESVSDSDSESESENTHFTQLLKEINSDDSLLQLEEKSPDLNDFISECNRESESIALQLGLNTIKVNNLNKDIFFYREKIKEANTQLKYFQVMKNKLINDYNSKKMNITKIEELKKTYKPSEIFNTIKIYANDNKLDLNNVKLMNIINSSAGFEGWFKSIINSKMAY